MSRKMVLSLAFAASVLFTSVGSAIAQPGGMASPNPYQAPVEAPSKGFDRTKFPRIRANLEAPDFRKSFPNLGKDYEVEAVPTPVYNCIAWSLQITNEWVWPGMSFKDFDRLYGEHGYVRQEWMDTRLEPGVEKIVLYGNFRSDGTLIATHGSRQMADGTWTSKIGGNAQIRHRTPDALSGPTYGTPIALYVRIQTTNGQ